MELSRRFFLGGMLSVAAASTFVPSVNALGNMSMLCGDGVNDDTSGLGALFRKEPLIFPKEKIGLDDWKNPIIHNGKYRVTNTIELPPGLDIKIEWMEFIGRDLDETLPFLRGREKELDYFTGLFTRYTDPITIKRQYMTLAAGPIYTEDEIEEMRKASTEAFLIKEAAYKHKMRNQSTYANWDRAHV